MAAFKWYDIACLRAQDGTYNAGSPQISIAAQPLTLALLTTAYTFSAAHAVFADVSANEIAAGNGYSAGGVAFAGLTFTQSAPDALLKCTGQQTAWTASGGSIAAWQFAVAYINATVNSIVKPLLFAVDAGGAQGPTASGSQTGINWNATAIYKVSHN